MTRADIVSERFVMPSGAASKRAPDDAGESVPDDGASFPELIMKMSAPADQRAEARSAGADPIADPDRALRRAAEEWLKRATSGTEPQAPVDNPEPKNVTPEVEPLLAEDSDSVDVLLPPGDPETTEAVPSPNDGKKVEVQGTATTLPSHIVIGISSALSAPPRVADEPDITTRADAGKMPAAPLDTETARATRAAANLQVKVSVIHQEAHFAPVPPPVLQQELAEQLAKAGAGQTKESAEPTGTAVSRSADSVLPREPSVTAVTEAPSSSDSGLGHSRGSHTPGGSALPWQPPKATPDAEAGGGRIVALERLSSLSETQAQPTGGAPSPGQQIASRVLAELSSRPEGSSAPAPQLAAAAAKPSSGSVLKVLHIRLEPADLGTVTVHMSLKDGALELHVEAARSETAQVIGKDKEALSHLLRSAGYRVEGLAVNVGDAGSSGASTAQPGGQGPTSTPQFSSQAQPGGSQSNSNSPHSGARDAEQRQNGPPTRSGNAAEDPAPARSGGALYV